MSAQASMTDLEYVQNMPAPHLLLQRQVNTQLWRVWNLADHKRVHEEFPYNFDATLLSPGMELAHAQRPYPDAPPSIPMGYSICSRRWRQEEEWHINARFGEIFLAKDGTGRWPNAQCISYALERIDEPRRWNRYTIYHLPSERFIDVIQAHIAHRDTPATAPATAPATTPATTIAPSDVAAAAAVERVEYSDDDEEEKDDE